MSCHTQILWTVLYTVAYYMNCHTQILWTVLYTVACSNCSVRASTKNAWQLVFINSRKNTVQETPIANKH